MKTLQFLFGTGWGIPWHMFFYLCTVPMLICLSMLRKNKRRETMLLMYALGSVLLVLFSWIHTVVFTVGWQVRPLMKYPTAALSLFLFCVIAWTLIPYLFQRGKLLKVAGVHVLVGMMVFLNLWTLWHVQSRRAHTIHAETHGERLP